jgi:hypothetical protein
MRVTNGIPLGCSLLLPVHTVNSVQTLQVQHHALPASMRTYINGRGSSSLPIGTWERSWKMKEGLQLLFVQCTVLGFINRIALDDWIARLVG